MTAPPFSRELYLEWRAPRRGTTNPERLTNPVWAWLAQSRLSAYQANAALQGPSSIGGAPAWCNQRFGQTVTELPDGRTVAVAGEHEDHYDPDFYIYNDVLITAPDGTVQIYAYPEADFPPTDFHTATLVGARLFLIGCLGYPRQRQPGTTPVHVLDLETLRITPLASGGERPGWLFRHEAALVDDHIIVRGGQRDVGETFLDNGDDWSLDLATLNWARLSDRRWEEWELARATGRANELFAIWSMAFHVGGTTAFDRQQLAHGEQQLGRIPDFALYAARFRPPVPHTVLPEREDDGVGVHRIDVEGVVVRYVESSFSVRLIVEGSLAVSTVAALVEDARSKLERLEETAYVAQKRA